DDEDVYYVQTEGTQTNCSFLSMKSLRIDIDAESEDGIDVHKRVPIETYDYTDVLDSTPIVEASIVDTLEEDAHDPFKIFDVWAQRIDEEQDKEIWNRIYKEEQEEKEREEAEKLKRSVRFIPDDIIDMQFLDLVFKIEDDHEIDEFEYNDLRTCLKEFMNKLSIPIKSVSQIQKLERKYNFKFYEIWMGDEFANHRHTYFDDFYSYILDEMREENEEEQNS
ncbi:MAG: hypothetical protein RLY43_773, partial [Bacteroidota bacterium]